MGYLRHREESWGMRCPQVTFTVRGRWWRLYAGVTFKTDRVRWNSGYGFRLFAVRLWRERIVGIQTRKEAADA